MSLKSVDLKEVKAIVDWVNLTEGVREFSLKFGELELFISRNNTSAAFARVAPVQSSLNVMAPPAPAAASSPVPFVAPTSAVTAGFKASEALAVDEVLIKAPMVGTFYAGPKPGSPNFVNVGDPVTTKTVLCIVEVMKLMNSIEAGVEGSVTKIFVENEQPVEYGQPLMIIRKRS